LTLAGANPTRQRLLTALHENRITVSGFALQYLPGDHKGSTMVDLAIYTRDQRFLH
jgi:branched-chain amino acid transport system substrate-binding protein